VSGLRAAIKIHLLHLVGILFPHNIDDARSKPHQIKIDVEEWDSTLTFRLDINVWDVN
jgi:hypothetical protein